MSNIINNISAPSTVSVYQTWNMSNGDEVRRAAYGEDAGVLRRLLSRPDSAAYSGSINLAEDKTLEEMFMLLQNDFHAEGWVKATGAQDGWVESEGSAPSLSVGDLLHVQNGPVETRFVVGMIGFVQL